MFLDPLDTVLIMQSHDLCFTIVKPRSTDEIDLHSEKDLHFP